MPTIGSEFNQMSIVSWVATAYILTFDAFRMYQLVFYVQIFQWWKISAWLLIRGNSPLKNFFFFFFDSQSHYSRNFLISVVVRWSCFWELVFSCLAPFSVVLQRWVFLDSRFCIQVSLYLFAIAEYHHVDCIKSDLWYWRIRNFVYGKILSMKFRHDICSTTSYWL